MKNYIAMLTFLFSLMAFADPTVFNMELGKTTETQVEKLYNEEYLGENKYSDGSAYSIATSDIDFEGLQKLTVVFNKNETLVGVFAKFPKNKFDDLNKMLSKKYKVMSKNIPYVGNKKVVYRNGDTEISLIAPHMSFELSLEYIRDELNDSYERLSKEEKQEKEQSESAQL